MLSSNQLIDEQEMKQMSEPVGNIEEVEHTAQRLARARTTHGDERRRSLVLAAFDLIAEKGFEELRTRAKLFVVLGELVMRSQRHPELERAMQRMDEQWMQYLGWILAEGVAQGQFRADLDPETTAKKIIVVVKGITFSYVWSRQEVDFEGMLQIVERLVLPEPSQGDV